MTASGENVYRCGCADIFTALERWATSVVTWQSLARGLKECMALFTLIQVQVNVHYCSKSYSWLCLIDISISLMNTNGIKCQDGPQIEYEASSASAWEDEQGFKAEWRGQLAGLMDPFQGWDDTRCPCAACAQRTLKSMVIRKEN